MTKFASDNIEYIRKIIRKRFSHKEWIIKDNWIIQSITEDNSNNTFVLEIYYNKDNTDKKFRYLNGYMNYTFQEVTYNDINQLKRRDKLKRLKIC